MVGVKGCLRIQSSVLRRVVTVFPLSERLHSINGLLLIRVGRHCFWFPLKAQGAGEPLGKLFGTNAAQGATGDTIATGRAHNRATPATPNEAKARRRLCAQREA